MKRCWCSKSCSLFVAASARLARRPSSSRARIVFQSIGNVSLSLRETLFEYTSRTNIDRMRAEFSSKHKRRSLTTRLLLKNIRVRCLVLVVVAERVVRLSFTYDGEITFGETSRANFPQKRKKSSLCALLCVVSVVVSQKTVAAFDTKKKNKEERERERGFYRARSYYISASLVFLQKRVFLLPRGVVYWCVQFVSRGGCARRMLERGEEDSFPLHHGRRRRGGCDFWSHASSAQHF